MLGLKMMTTTTVVQDDGGLAAVVATPSLCHPLFLGWLVSLR
jgi:hypothetical protein